MSHTPLRRPFALIAGGGLAAFLLLRIGIAFPAWSQSNPDDLAWRLSLWGLETVGTSLILLTAVAGCGWLAARARRRDHEQAHVEHLAEVGLLAGGLAHEIRNSLNAMHSQLALLRKHLPLDAGSQACQRAGQVERAMAELEELVGDFLAFARPAKDRPEEVDLAALVGEVLEFAALDLEQGRVKVATGLGPSLPPVYADAGKLKRALLNLIINARQAMPEGGTLTIRARPAEKDAVVVEVSDTGCGIPEEDRSRIFQTFFSTKPGGTGLGLAVVRRTVEVCGGRIAFDSEVGRGTTFRIHLPAAERRRVTLKRQARSQQRVETSL